MITVPAMVRHMEILLAEDNPGDVELLREILDELAVAHRLSVVEDGEEALAYLNREGGYAAATRPDLIVLDLNLPRRDGRQVLAAVKADARLKCIPVVILTTSKAQDDVRTCYDSHANCYIVKPRQFDQFRQAMKVLEAFWFAVVTLPPGE